MVRMGSMTRAKRILLSAGMLVLSLSSVYGSIWHRNDRKPADAAPAIAAMSLTAVETDASSPSRLLIRTSGTPAYTSYSPAPDVFVVDLTDTAKAESFARPSTFPAGISSVTAEDVTEMGSRLTRVTVHLAHPGTVETSVADNAVAIMIPASLAAEAPAAAPAIPVVAPIETAAATETPAQPLAPATTTASVH